jgi:hypothetical protein
MGLPRTQYWTNTSITPHVWYDASNDRDLQDSLCIGGALILMAGASVSYHANKLRHVGSAGSSENKYMELERATRRIMWLRNLLTSMQMYRVTKLSHSVLSNSSLANVKPIVNTCLNYGRETRLCT